MDERKELTRLRTLYVISGVEIAGAIVLAAATILRAHFAGAWDDIGAMLLSVQGCIFGWGAAAAVGARQAQLTHRVYMSKLKEAGEEVPHIINQALLALQAEGLIHPGVVLDPGCVRVEDADAPRPQPGREKMH